MSKMNELSQAIDELIACGKGLVEAAEALKKFYSSEPDEAPSNTKEEAAPAKAPEAEAKQYTFTDVRKAFSAKSHAGYTKQVKDLIARYGADKLSAIKEEDYAAIMADLEAIS